MKLPVHALLLSIFLTGANLIAQDSKSSLITALYAAIDNRSFEQCHASCVQLCALDIITPDEFRAILAHALARAYRSLVTYSKKSAQLSAEKKIQTRLLMLCTYLLGGVIANRFFGVGINKQSAWIWFPIARACSYDYDRKVLMNIGIGLLFSQLIATAGLSLYGIIYSIPLLITNREKWKKNSYKKAAIKRIILYLEGLYYAAQNQ